MVAWISIMVLLVLSFVFARYKRNIKVNYYVFSEILLLFGSMGVYLLIESINDSIQYVTWNGVLSIVIPFPVAKGYEFKRYCYIL